MLLSCYVYQQIHPGKIPPAKLQDQQGRLGAGVPLEVGGGENTRKRMALLL